VLAVLAYALKDIMYLDANVKETEPDVAVAALLNSTAVEDTDTTVVPLEIPVPDTAIPTLIFFKSAAEATVMVVLPLVVAALVVTLPDIGIGIPWEIANGFGYTSTWKPPEVTFKGG
jgi:hypothetical protein